MENWTKLIPDRPLETAERFELICGVFEFGAPQSLSLEWLLDKVEADEWGGIWW